MTLSSLKLKVRTLEVSGQDVSFSRLQVPPKSCRPIWKNIPSPVINLNALFADKAYPDTETKAVLAARGTYLLTPYKRRRNEPEANVLTLLDCFVSSIRQPLESLFGWMIQRTDLQNASRVRSTNGLLAHCYGKLAVPCLLLIFYS